MALSRKIVPALIALLVGVGAGLLFRSKGPDTPPPTPTAVSAPVSAPDVRDATSPSHAPASPINEAAPSPATPLLSGETALEAISDLAATYDAASVPALARYLKHQNPDIRTAARDGLINLGERAAIPFLQEAAKTAPPEEANALREAAEFLALPTWTERREAQKKARAQQAAGQ